MKGLFKCLNCGNEFEENNASIIEYGTGAVLSKVEYFSCPKCESINIQDDSGKIQS